MHELKVDVSVVDVVAGRVVAGVLEMLSANSNSLALSMAFQI